MYYQKFDNVYVIRIERGEEIVASLLTFCREQGITLGTIQGIGAVDNAVIGLFDPQEKQYYSKTLTKDHEITGLNGNITSMNGAPYLHLHVNLGDAKHIVHGGHLNSAIVSATVEIFLTTCQGKVDRFQDEETGLNLLDLPHKIG